MTAGLFMRFPTFSASAADSRTINPDGLQVVKNDNRKIFEVPNSEGVLIIAVGDDWTFKLVTKMLNRNSRFLGKMTVELTTAVCLDCVNAHLDDCTGHVDTDQMKLKIADENSVELVVLNSTAANLITPEENSLVGSHKSEPILRWSGAYGIGATWIHDYWTRCLNAANAYAPPQHEDNQDKVINFMARAIREACEGSNTCGGEIWVKTVDNANVVRRRVFTQMDPTYSICLAPYHPQMDHP